MPKTWRTSLFPLAAAATLLAGAPPLFAQEAEGNGVTLRGFVSQGYLHSSANRFLDTDTDEGTFAYSEAALNFTAQPQSKVRVAAQLLARDVGPQGNNRIVLDWGLGEYRAWDTLGFRIGRVKFPVGLYNTLADADVARPEILQPSGLYPLDRRDLTNAVDGGGVFGTISLGGAGYLEYEGMYGTLDIDDTYLLGRIMNSAGAGLVPALTALRFSNVNYVVTEQEGKSDRAWGGHVEWSPPVSGLRLRTGVQGVSADFGGVTTYSAFAGTAPVSLSVRSDIHVEVPRQLTFSAEYRRENLRLTAEHARFRVENTTTLSGTPFPAPPPSTRITHPQSTYGQIAYRFNSYLQASGFYSVSYADSKDKEGQNQVRRGEAAHAAWVKDLAFTLRVDVNPHWLVKAEVHRFDGTYNLSAAENREPLEQEWTMFVVKTTLHF
jgi:hypothetical protein